MQRNGEARYFLAGILVISFCACLLWPDRALSESGIRLKENITANDSTAAQPPPFNPGGGYIENIYRFKIKNKNIVCNEDVNIGLNPPIIGFVNDPEGSLYGLGAKGYAHFLGFKKNLNNAWSSQLHWEMVDESSQTVYLGVKTGEDANGCDFRSFEVEVGICDSGPHCFFCCDDYQGDIPCENPTKLTNNQIYKAEPFTMTAGAGTIQGQVTRLSNGNGVVANISILKIGTCVFDSPDNDEDFSMNIATEWIPQSETGKYAVPSLPFGNYWITAITVGFMQTKTQNVNSTAPYTVDFSIP